jgi:hypothetical protein
MYQTREIPREGWSDYLTLLSNIERDHWVRIEMESPDEGGHLMASRLPLVDISVEEKGRGAGTIEVTVGRPGEEITHRIFHPDHLYAGESESGELECLDIEDAEHMKTHIYFEPMMPMDECVAPM